MALILLLGLIDAVIGYGQWVIITSSTPEAGEFERWCETIEIAERSVGRYLDLPQPLNPVLRVAPTSDDFATWTGLSVWHAAAIVDGELVVQPQAVLERRGVLKQVLIHEYVHLLLEPYRVSRWLNEGLAILCSGELKTLAETQDLKNLPTKKGEIEKLLLSNDTLELKRGYLAAGVLTQELTQTVGRDSLIRLIKEEAL